MPKQDNEPPAVASSSKHVKVTPGPTSKTTAKPKKEKVDPDLPILDYVLIPLAFNDRTLIPQTVLDGVLDQLFLAFDGHTIEGVVDGTYRLASGQKCVEKSTKIAVALKVKEKKQLVAMAKEWAYELQQEAIMITFTTSRLSSSNLTREGMTNEERQQSPEAGPRSS
jgi:hypothetical protein